MKQCRGQLSMFSAEASLDHASRSVLPGSEEARRMTVTSGQKCSELYRNSGPLGLLVRMCLESSIWHSTKCFLTWKTKVTKANALLFQLAVSMPHTNDTESQFWPTLLANGLGSTGHQMMLQRMVETGILSKEERRAMIMGNGGKINPGWAEWLMGYMQQFTKLLPTPISADYRGGSLGRYWMPKNPSESLQKIHVERERERESWDEQTRIRQYAPFSGMQSPWEDWLPEPGVDRVADGIPNRVDRIKCLGNAVVPQQFYPFFRAIYIVETTDPGDIREYL